MRMLKRLYVAACLRSITKRGLCLTGIAMQHLILLTLPGLALAEPSLFNPSNLPIPRFVSLKSDEVNVRIGPGTRYEIGWTYRRDGLPVEIIEEFGYWRKIRDHEDSTGWVHKSLLAGQRNVMLKKGIHELYRSPSTKSAVVLKAKEGVIGEIEACELRWCLIEIQRRRGWIEKSALWGTYADEIIDD